MDEVPIEGRHARLAAGVDGAEGDVLEPLQVPDHLGRVQLSLGLDDRCHVRVGACVRCIHERLQPFHLLDRFAHHRIMPPADPQAIIGEHNDRCAGLGLKRLLGAAIALLAPTD